MAEIGLPTDDLHTKPSSQFFGKVAVRYAIIVCERAKRSCPRAYRFAAQTVCWPFEDPAAFEGTDAERPEKFCEVRDPIASHTDQWLDALSGGLA